MGYENTLTAKRCRNLSGRLLEDELNKRFAKGVRAAERREKKRSYTQARLWKKLPRCERHQTSPIFPLFPELPVELRIKIWELSFRGRIVEVYVDFNNWWYEDDDPEMTANRPEPHISVCHTVTPNLATLFVNHESRAETLKHYFDLLPSVSDVPIYFNFQLDSFTLHFFNTRYGIAGSSNASDIVMRIRNLVELSSSPLLRSIKSLIFTDCTLYHYPFTHRARSVATTVDRMVEVEWILKQFGSLEEIIIITADSIRPSTLSGFGDSALVQTFTENINQTFEKVRESDPSFQIPQVTIYPEPFRRPMFCDEMQEAYDSRNYEDTNLEETADWFDSEF